MLDLIINNEDGDRLMDSKRRKLFRAPLEEADIIKEVLGVEVTEADQSNVAEVDMFTTMGKEIARKLGGVL